MYFVSNVTNINGESVVYSSFIAAAYFLGLFATMPAEAAVSSTRRCT